MSARRVLFVELNEDGTTGGSHVALLDIVRHLDRRRYEPVVLFYQENDFVERVRALGGEAHVWTAERRLERGSGQPRLLRVAARPLTLAGAIRRRVRFLRDAGISLVHVNNSPSFAYEDWLPAARIAGVPIVSHVRGELFRPGRLTSRLLVPRFDRLVAISRYVETIPRAVGVPARSIELIHDGVDLAHVRDRAARDDPAAVRAALGVAPDETLAVMVGHLRAWKGQHVVLDAMRRLDPALLSRLRVVFAGAPDRFSPGYHERLVAECAAPPLAGRATLLGPRSDAPALMQAADVVLHASTVPEPFGLVVVEAMALGRPVIASALGGPGEVLEGDCGWTFDPAQPQQLAACLEAVIAHPAQARRVGAAARVRAESFDVRDTVRRLERLYAELGVA